MQVVISFCCLLLKMFIGFALYVFLLLEVKKGKKIIPY